MTDTLTACLWRLSEPGHGAVLGGDIARRYAVETIDRLLAAGVLEELAPTTEWPPCVDCECALGFRPIRCINGRHVACCPLDPGSDLALDPEDLRGFRVDAERFLSLLGQGSGLVGPVETLAPGLWRIGRLSSGRVIAAALPARALQSAGSVLLLKNGGSPITVVAREADQATRLRLLEASIDLVDLKLALTVDESLDRLDPTALEPRIHAPRLVIRVAEQAVTIDGVRQPVAAQPFRLLMLLAEHRRSGLGPVGNRTIENVTGRDPRDLVRELRDALSAGRINAEEIRRWIVARRSVGGFELMIDAQAWSARCRDLHDCPSSARDASDHADDLVLVGLLGAADADLPAAPEHADAVGKAEHLVEAVAHDQDRQVPSLEGEDRGLHPGRLGDA